jgi:hypothetical protein
MALAAPPTLLDQGQVLLHCFDVAKPDYDGNATRELVWVEMSVSSGKERHEHLIKDTTFDQPTQPCKQVGVLVFSETIVNLQVIELDFDNNKKHLKY